MSFAKTLSIASFAFVLSCGDNNRPKAGDGGSDGSTTDDGFHQVEHLARPGINEALLITTDFNIGYNATAPSFKGVPEPVLNQVVAEAKTVLKALYLGACLVNGVVPGGLTAQTGVHPADIECHAIGGALFMENNAVTGVTLTDLSKQKAQEYADKVFAQFIPDVMRIDTEVDSNYLTLCGDANAKPLLCGGRFLNDDAIDITYFYLLDGANPAHTATQFKALTSDGVNFSTTATGENGSGSRFTFADTQNNRQQGHPAVSTTFPYSAAPL
jgi:hypothetical protein